jgi:hypothetical protein
VKDKVLVESQRKMVRKKRFGKRKSGYLGFGLLKGITFIHFGSMLLDAVGSIGAEARKSCK